MDRREMGVFECTHLLYPRCGRDQPPLLSYVLILTPFHVVSSVFVPSRCNVPEIEDRFHGYYKKKLSRFTYLILALVYTGETNISV